MANTVDPDEISHHEQSHQDLHYFKKHLSWSVMLKELNNPYPANTQRRKNVVTTSLQRRDVAATLHDVVTTFL